MKTVFSLLFLSLLLVSCEKDRVMEEIIIPKEEPGKEEEKPVNPPAAQPVFLQFTASVKPLEEVTTKSAVYTFTPGNAIGVYYNDTCKNRKLTYLGTAGWHPEKKIALAEEEKNLYAYFPYKSALSSSLIPLSVNEQTDLLAGSVPVSKNNPVTSMQMQHALSLVKVVLMKQEYSGKGVVERVSWNGIPLQGTYDLFTGKIDLGTQKGTYQTGGNITLGSAPVHFETILLPMSSAKGVSIDILIDGEQRSYNLPEAHEWQPGKVYTYTLYLRGSYNKPIDLEEYPIDVTHWSTYGKNDEIILGTSEKDWFSIDPNDGYYGTDIYRNEGFMFGFLGYWTGYDVNTGEMPEKWEGDFRMVLMDKAGNIVEKFQPCAITVENGAMMKGTSRRSFVTAPAGEYELGVLFRKKGESVWIKADRLDNVTSKDLTYTIKEPTNLPALRMIQIEEETNTGVVIHDRPHDSRFNVTYTLSNRGRTPLKGEIKAVWERTFDYTGHCYRPSSKRKNTVNDYEWRDELGHVSIDLTADIRFWRGIIPCQFPVKRELPRTKEGIGYCGPKVHLYWRAEGSSEWVLLRCDLDPILAAKVNSSQEEANLWLKSLNYISFNQSHW